ncbi:cilia- and flagella-associated protein 263-like [Watersipora subatra]|uniref:cilia- and flagella-associated protein 263-like n=1 Tax=Watersipora subatra TaxID=2589382 RepID=UPI00355C6E01
MAESETMSIDTSNEAQDDPLQDLSYDKLEELVEATLRSNEILKAETFMFDKYTKRIEPKDLGPSQAAAQGFQQSSISGQDQPTARGNRRRSRSRPSHTDKMQLRAEQKCDIAQREIEEIKEDKSRHEDESEKIVDNHKAEIEEAELRLGEIRKSHYEFDRDIVKGAVNSQTNKVVAEKVSRYFEDKLRGRETLVGKLRLKNSTLKVQKKKLHMQLKQKEEMGEVLNEVDFQQLKIENSQYLEKIEERNQDLLRLKLMATNTLQVLNSYKKKLHTLTLESDRLKQETGSREELLTRIDAETKMVEEERAKAEQINKRYRQQLSDYKVPEVMEYVTEKADLYELNKKVKSWERKVDIAEMALNTHRKTWSKIQMESGQPRAALYA